MTKTLFLGAGAALALMFSVSTEASAQAVPPQGTDPYSYKPPDAMVTMSAFGGFRAARPGDNDVRGFSLEEYREHFRLLALENPAIKYPGDESFYAMVDESRASCARNGSWIVRSVEFMGRANNLTRRNTGINHRLVALGDDLNNAARIRTGGNIISTGLLCLLSGGYYCGSAVAQGVSNQAQGMAHTKQSKLNRDQSILNSDQSQLQLDISVLNLEMNIGWVEMMHGYCLSQHPDATIGAAAPTAEW